METNGTVRIYTISSIVVEVTNVQKKIQPPNYQVWCQIAHI